jgi:hypothetical protein
LKDKQEEFDNFKLWMSDFNKEIDTIFKWNSIDKNSTNNINKDCKNCEIDKMM